jgi:copper homeostasis protein
LNHAFQHGKTPRDTRLHYHLRIRSDYETSRCRFLNVEVCIESDGDLDADVRAAYNGGATTIELCRSMEHEGLTPTPDQIATARKAFSNRPGLMVMIRPRPGTFSYTPDETDQMTNQISNAAAEGANGVVFGALTDANRIDVSTTRSLIERSRNLNLTTTFHRAFDAANDRDAALDSLLDLGIDQVLTCGTPWGSPGQATDGLRNLRSTIDRALGRIEVVIAGGVSAATIPTILAGLPISLQHVSLHAYSGSQVDGRPTSVAIRSLIAAAHA